MYLDFNLWATIIFIIVMMGVLQGACAYQTLLERKISAWAQDRLGPNRVGPWGLLQPIVDGVKFLLKEEVIPRHVDKVFFLAAPMIAIATATVAFAVVPFGATTSPPQLLDHRSQVEYRDLSPADKQLLKNARELRGELEDPAEGSTLAGKRQLPVQQIWPQTREEEAEVLAADRAWTKKNVEKGNTNWSQITPYKEQLETYNSQIQFVIVPHTDIGIVWVFAIGSLAVYAIVLGGWSSNNKYSFLGALRSSAQLISYEIPLGLSVLGVFLLAGSLNLERIIDDQVENGWNVLFQPLAALLFVTAVFAECNRMPFDLSECEQELVGGYHTEYGALKFGLFFLGEYTHMITTSFLVAILFLGGWEILPFINWPGPQDNLYLNMAIKVAVLFGKMGLFIVFYMYVRWTIPRFRFDQLMGLAWKVLMPLALVSFVAVLLVQRYELSRWYLLPISLVILLGATYFTLRLPRPPGKAKLTVRGHGTGRPLGTPIGSGLN
jgi:NADH-quinone oxidoreductase subunit H